MAIPIKVTDLNSTKFYQLPKAFFHNPIYTDMKNETKIAYSVLRDLLELSIKNNWINEFNEIYVKLSREKLMKYLNVKGTEKITKIMKELSAKELIVEKRLGLNKVNEIYVCIPVELDIVYNDEKLLIDDSKINEPSKIECPEILKSNVQTFENRTHTKTNYTKTNITNLLVVDAAQLFEDDICKLKKTTKTQFEKYCNDYDIDFIMATIELCSEINTESFAGFKTIIGGYIEKGITSRQALKTYVGEYRNTSKKLRDKEREKRKDRAAATTSNKNKPVKGSFNDYEQRAYDFDELEKKLLGWDNKED